MVRKIKVSSIYEEKPEPEATEEAPDEETSEQAEPPPEPVVEAKVESEYSSEDEQPIVIPTKTKPAKKPMLDMPTTSKTLEQVECQACGRKMSAKTLKYSHARYCKELKDRDPEPEKKEPLRRTKTIHHREAIEEEEQTHPPTPVIPEPTIETEESFGWKLVQRKKQKEAKYQIMMSNAF
jgi:hypothetical protein